MKWTDQKIPDRNVISFKMLKDGTKQSHHENKIYPLQGI